MNNIVSIRVFGMYETCERTTFYVELTSDEGFTKTPDAHRTGSIYNDFEGLTREEARDRALMDAHEWSDFLGIEIEPFVEDSVVIEPFMKFETYTTRRKLAKRREAA